MGRGKAAASSSRRRRARRNARERIDRKHLVSIQNPKRDGEVAASKRKRTIESEPTSQITVDRDTRTPCSSAAPRAAWTSKKCEHDPDAIVKYWSTRRSFLALHRRSRSSRRSCPGYGKRSRKFARDSTICLWITARTCSRSTRWSSPKRNGDRSRREGRPRRQRLVETSRRASVEQSRAVG